MSDFKNNPNIRISKAAILSVLLGTSSLSIFVYGKYLLFSGLVYGCSSMAVSFITLAFSGVTGFLGLMIGIIALILLKKNDFLKGQAVAILGILFGSIPFVGGFFSLFVELFLI